MYDRYLNAYNKEKEKKKRGRARQGMAKAKAWASLATTSHHFSPLAGSRGHIAMQHLCGNVGRLV